MYRTLRYVCIIASVVTLIFLGYALSSYFHRPQTTTPTQVYSSQPAQTTTPTQAYPAQTTAPTQAPYATQPRHTTIEEQINSLFIAHTGKPYYCPVQKVSSYYWIGTIDSLLYDINNYKRPIPTKSWLELYKEHVFDCSEMTAFLEHLLENNGIECNIARGKTPKGHHAWLLFPTMPDQAVESTIPRRITGLEVVLNDVVAEALGVSSLKVDYYFNPISQYRTIFEAVESGIPIKEFDWWNSYYPSLLDYAKKMLLLVNFDGWYVGGSKVTVAKKGESVVAKVSLTAGESGRYTMRIRRDVVGAADETVHDFSFDYDGVSCSIQSRFTPPYATGEASTDGYHIDLVKGAFTVWTLTDAYPPRLRVTR